MFFKVLQSKVLHAYGSLESIWNQRRIDIIFAVAWNRNVLANIPAKMVVAIVRVIWDIQIKSRDVQKCFDPLGNSTLAVEDPWGKDTS